jgi:hypothetical protein
MDIDYYNVLGDQPLEEGTENISLQGIRDQILQGDSIRFDEIKSLNGLMVAWKFAVKRRYNYRMESIRFLRGLAGKNPSKPGPQAAIAGEEETAVDFPPDVAEDAFRDGDRFGGLEVTEALHTASSSGTTTQMSPPQMSCPSLVDPAWDELCGANQDQSCESQGKPSLHAPLKIQGAQLEALIDTGATSNFIQLQFLQEHLRHVVITPVTRMVTLGNGSQTPLEGEIKVTVWVGDVEMRDLHFFVMRSSGPPIILGYSWLMEHSAVLDCKTRKISLNNGKTIQCRMTSSSQKKGQDTGKDPMRQISVLRQEVATLRQELSQLQEEVKQKN